MSTEAISEPSRKLLNELRDLLLEQHKLLLTRERVEYEKVHGPIGGPSSFLTLVLNDPHFAWLRQISTLVVEIDEALSRRSNADQQTAEVLTQRARELLRPLEKGSDFQMRYWQAVQESPDAVILQCRVEQLLGI